MGSLSVTRTFSSLCGYVYSCFPALGLMTGPMFFLTDDEHFQVSQAFLNYFGILMLTCPS